MSKLGWYLDGRSPAPADVCERVQAREALDVDFTQRAARAVEGVIVIHTMLLLLVGRPRPVPMLVAAVGFVLAMAILIADDADGTFAMFEGEPDTTHSFLRDACAQDTLADESVVPGPSPSEVRLFDAYAFRSYGEDHLAIVRAPKSRYPNAAAFYRAAAPVADAPATHRSCKHVRHIEALRRARGRLTGLNARVDLDLRGRFVAALTFPDDEWSETTLLIETDRELVLFYWSTTA
jgi:hypothetical protein